MKQIKFALFYLIVIGMIVVSNLTGNKEIIFPELAALAAGTLLSPKMPWEVSKLRLVILMSIGSVLGVLLVYLSVIPLVFKVLIAFVAATICLICSKTTMFPMISAAVLPILMGTDSLIYPLSVIIMSIIIVLVQKGSENLGITEAKSYEPHLFSIKKESLRILLMSVFVLISTFIGTNFDCIYIIAPPVIVAFADMSFLDGKASDHPVKTFLTISACALSGAASQIIFCNILNFTTAVSVFIAITAVLIIFRIAKFILPPAAALAVLPAIIPESSVILYPFEVACGSIIFIALSILIKKIVDKEMITNAILLQMRSKA